MLDLQDLTAPLLAPRPGGAVPAADDWQQVAEQDLREAHAAACALFAAAPAGSAERLRHARSAVLLEQLLAARAVQRARRVGPDAARASLRGDHALGYFFGLAASEGDPGGPPPGERALTAALRHVHGLVFGLREAHRLAESDLVEVGDAFGDGLLAAEADLQAFLARGPAATPSGLLAAMPWVGCCAGARVPRPT
jgi:hypothetical protein